MLRRLYDHSLPLLRRVVRGSRIAHDLSRVGRGEQMLLALRYQEMVRNGAELPGISEAEFRCFSQNGEDGVLHYVFSLLGHGNRTVVEIGCGDGLECNSANLLINHGWTGLLIDADPALIERGRRFYAECPDTRVWPPQLICTLVSPNNVGALLARHGVGRELDLLSVDIDSMDYWVLKACLEHCEPRVFMVEANNVWGAEERAAVPYDPNFVPEYVDGAPDYSGASLAAFAALADARGYRLVGTQRYGFNAVFVRNGEGEKLLPAVPVESCLRHPQSVHARTVRRGRLSGKPIVVPDV